MLNVAICDDNLEDLSNITLLLGEYINTQKNKPIIEYTSFQNALDLIISLESAQKYDLILLDIVMPLVTGMSAAKEIREFNKDVKIVFLTSSTEFAFESYSVSAYDYILKPIDRKKFFFLLDKIISEKKNQINTSFLVKSKIGLTRIYINKLEFAEINGRTILYNLTNGLIIEAPGSMIELEKLLSNSLCFIKPHRSYIINMNYIVTLLQREIKMRSFSHVPISKANYSSIKSAYINFSFND